jgi:hypothetical protein
MISRAVAFVRALESFKTAITSVLYCDMRKWAAARFGTDPTPMNPLFDRSAKMIGDRRTLGVVAIAASTATLSPGTRFSEPLRIQLLASHFFY